MSRGPHANRAQESGGPATTAASTLYDDIDKKLRDKLSSMQMDFNSGVANIKKVLDDVQDKPHMIGGKV